MERLKFPSRLLPEVLERAAPPIYIEFSAEALSAVQQCRCFVERCIESGRPVYGATTGYGALVGYAGRDDLTDHGLGLIDFLSVGQGCALSPDLARAMLLVRVWSLAQGRSGISPAALAALSEVLAAPVAPVVPEYGSVGASGDLVPLAHAVSGLMGRGYLWIRGSRLPAEIALRKANLRPLKLTGRDALALVNGTPLTTAAAGLACSQAIRSTAASIALSALMLEVLGADAEFASPELLAAYGHPGAEAVAFLLRQRMQGSITSGHRPLQEPYSLRCVPQLVGATWASVQHVYKTVIDDLNGVSDNPLFWVEKDKVVHGGNFFSQPIALAADLLSGAVTQLANLAERQLDLLMDPHRNTGINPSLATQPGVQHGLTGAQIAATSFVIAMRRAAVPAAMQSISTNQHNQDVVPSGTQAALTAQAQMQRLRWVHGTLAIALRQAVYLGGRTPTSDSGRILMRQLCEVIDPVERDRPLDSAVRLAADLLDRVLLDDAQLLLGDCHEGVAREEPGFWQPSVVTTDDSSRTAAALKLLKT